MNEIRLIPEITQQEIKNLFKLKENPPTDSFETTLLEVGKSPPITKPF
jgi:hypothetical protein